MEDFMGALITWKWLNFAPQEVPTDHGVPVATIAAEAYYRSAPIVSTILYSISATISCLPGLLGWDLSLRWWNITRRLRHTCFTTKQATTMDDRKMCLK